MRMREKTVENEIRDYIRKVNYYETDKMGITHHSNYIRWMEEARTDFLNQNGCGYAKFEAFGVVSPVLSLSCQYKRSTTFEDEIRIHVRLVRYTGIRLTFRYTMTDIRTGETVFIGESEHCFLGQNGCPVMVMKRFPAFHEILKGLTAEEK